MKQPAPAHVLRRDSWDKGGTERVRIGDPRPWPPCPYAAAGAPVRAARESYFAHFRPRIPAKAPESQSKRVDRLNRKAGLTRRVLPQLFLVTLRKRYDTDAATLIGSAASALDKDRPEFWSASLYKGTGGAYFLAGSGGFRNQFAATQEDGTVKGGSKIVPLTSGDAQTWAEQHLDPTTIAANHRHRRLISGAGPPARACDGPLRAGTVAPRDRLVLVENDF